MQSAYNTSNERYFNQTSKTSSQGPSSIASSSSALPANSSPNSSNVPTSTSYRSNSQIYSNYYIQMSQQSNTQNLMPSSNQTYQNVNKKFTLFKLNPKQNITLKYTLSRYLKGITPNTHLIYTTKI